MNNVIVITRQFGSLGRYIARIVSHQMGYEYYDRNSIDQYVKWKNEGFRIENPQSGMSEYEKMAHPLGSGSLSTQEKLFDMEKEVILSLSEKGNAVIVGRCADYILKEYGTCNVFSVFIYAPVIKRYYFGVNNFGITKEAVMNYIEKVDKARELYYKRHTGESFISIRYRDLMIDSSCGSLNDIADMICYCAKKKFDQ